jgi:transcriptional regulator with XRE-family HTH domain
MTAALTLAPHAHMQAAMAELLVSAPRTMAELAAELQVSANDAEHILARLRRRGLPVATIEGLNPEPRYRVLYPKGRVCAAQGCGTLLRRTNPSDRCERHGGGVLRLRTAPPPPRPASRPGGRSAAATQLSGARIRAERERRCIGLRTLAALVGISPAYLSRIERGQRGLSAEVSSRLEAALADAPAPPAIDGAALRAAREAHGLSLREFAQLVGLSAGFLSRLENGRRPVTPGVASRLERASAARG